MKKICNIYSKIISKENLYAAAYMAARGRRYRDTSADFNFHLEEEIDRLHRELSTKTYRHGKYRLFTIYEPKERKIAAAPFRDRVIHHAVHDVIEPLIDKTFIYDSYACRKNKGTHKAVNRAQEFLRGNKFCFHGDVKKYFPSINHHILKGILRKRIGDEELLCLLDEIIDSANGILQVANGKWDMANSEEAISHSLYAISQKGLPIGNLTSQFFANLYLNELDYFVKLDLRLRYYLRYMDDFLIFSNDKKELLEIRETIRAFLKDRLDLNMQEEKSQVYKTKHGIKFLGFKIFKDYRRLTSDNVRRFRKRLKRFAYLFENGKIDTQEICDSVRCWVAHSKYANTKGLRLNIWRQIANSKWQMASGKKATSHKLYAISHLLKDVLLDGIDIKSGERKRERISERANFS